MKTTTATGEHYLKRELFELLSRDPSVLEFLDQATLDGLWFWNLERPEDEWLSPKLKSVLGYRDDEVPNRSSWWQAVIHPDDLALARENFERHKADPAHPYDQTVRYRHKDGSTVWVRCRGLILREDGRPVRMLGAHTELTALQAELQAAKQDLERLYEDTPAKLHALDREGRIVFVSRRWLRHFGYSREEVVGRPWTEFMTEASHQRVDAELRPRFLESGETVDEPLVWLRRDGEECEVLWSATAERDEEGTFVRSLEFLRDVTRENRTRRALEQSHDLLSRSLQDLEEYAYVTSHDLRAPLRGISSIVQFIREDASPEAVEELAPRLAQLEERSNRMVAMLQGLLEYARAGQDDPVPVHGLDELASKLVTETQAAYAGGRRTRVQVTSEGLDGRPIWLPRVVFQHVLMNLVANALVHHDGTDAGVDVAVRLEEAALVVTVEDDGPGIKPDDQQRVFQMFRRASNKPKGESTGMGLALVRRMLFKAGGSITLASPLRGNRGCRFVATLPIRKEKERR